MSWHLPGALVAFVWLFGAGCDRTTGESRGERLTARLRMRAFTHARAKLCPHLRGFRPAATQSGEFGWCARDPSDLWLSLRMMERSG